MKSDCQMYKQLFSTVDIYGVALNNWTALTFVIWNLDNATTRNSSKCELVIWMLYRYCDMNIWILYMHFVKHIFSTYCIVRVWNDLCQKKEKENKEQKREQKEKNIWKEVVERGRL